MNHYCTMCLAVNVLGKTYLKWKLGRKYGGTIFISTHIPGDIPKAWIHHNYIGGWFFFLLYEWHHILNAAIPAPRNEEVFHMNIAFLSHTHTQTNKIKVGHDFMMTISDNNYQRTKILSVSSGPSILRKHKKVTVFSRPWNSLFLDNAN